MSPPTLHRALGGTRIVLHRLRSFAPIPPHTQALIEGLTELQSCRAGSDLAAEGASLKQLRYLVSGWAARVRWLPDGRRQIFNLVVPGESIGVGLRRSPLAFATTVALTPVDLLDAAPVQRAIQGNDPAWSELRDAIKAASSYDECYVLNQILRLGRLTAYERVCHLLLELHDRLAISGLTQGAQFALPLTQEVLADVTGLSVVHVNRTLQQLRRERLLEIHAGRAHLLDVPALTKITDYRPPSPIAPLQTGFVDERED